MILRVFISIFFLSVISLSGRASNKDTVVNRIFSLIYNQQFNEAESLLNSQKDQLDDFYADVLKIDLHWWKYSSTRSKEDAKNLTELFKDFESSQINGQENEIIPIIIKSYQLRYQRKRYNLFRVISLRSEINQLLAELNRDELPISGNQLDLFDLYIAMFQYFENVNPFAITGKSSERKKYLFEMEEFAQKKDLILSTIAHYFLGRIYQKVEKEPEKGIVHFEFLSNKFPENKIFIEYLKDCERKI